MTVGVLMLYGVSLNSAQRLSQTLLTLGRRAVGSWQEAHELFAFLDTPPRLLPAAPGHAERGRASRSAEGLRLENISFRYPGTDAWAIRNLDIRIAPGEFVAVTGGNGSGKSTLLKLVTGLYSPTEGTIRLDGVDLASMDAPQARSRFAIVFQDFARYGLTVRENVVMGQPNFDADGAAVDAALRASCADDMVARLPDGMETELLPGLENGVDLSGGQWQRIALARGMVRDNADFLVLDEPTAALDAEAERRVFEHLRQLRGQMGVILVTHRLSVLDAADQVIELRHGQPLARRRPARARASPQLRGPGRAARSRLIPSASAPAPRAIRTPRSRRR